MTSFMEGRICIIEVVAEIDKNEGIWTETKLAMLKEGLKYMYACQI